MVMVGPNDSSRLTAKVGQLGVRESDSALFYIRQMNRMNARNDCFKATLHKHCMFYRWTGIWTLMISETLRGERLSHGILPTCCQFIVHP